MTQPIFVSGIGTGIGKTLVSAILAEALQADYWKPVQAGFDDGTDSEWIKSLLTNTQSKIYPELYRLKQPASPHLAARMEGVEISLEKIRSSLSGFTRLGQQIIIEGAGGLMVP